MRYSRSENIVDVGTVIRMTSYSDEHNNSLVTCDGDEGKTRECGGRSKK